MPRPRSGACSADPRAVAADDGTADRPPSRRARRRHGSQAGTAGRACGCEKIGDFDQPLYVAQPPGQRATSTWSSRPGASGSSATASRSREPLLDISDEVSDRRRAGPALDRLRAGLHRARASSTPTTPDTGQDQQVVEYTPPGTATASTPAAAREVMRMDDFASNHNGGLLLFGPDGLPLHRHRRRRHRRRPAAQRAGPRLAARQAAADRPGPSGGRRTGSPPTTRSPTSRARGPEVYSYGLRNPWRFSFDRETGALSIGDVGQNTLEEIDYVPAGDGRGANFGWSAYEGDRPLQSATSRPRTPSSRCSPTATTRAARSPAATWSATPRCPRCRGATSTATSARASCAASCRR